ncbi:MAG: hypothetical protein ACYC6P_13230 [Ignavibacteriaceae bacterium]
MMDTGNKYKIDLCGEMHKQINTTSLNIQIVIPGEGIAKTFQKVTLQYINKYGFLKKLIGQKNYSFFDIGKVNLFHIMYVIGK